MKINPLLVFAALALAIPGLALTFAPAELLAMTGEAAGPAEHWLAQLLGAALLGLAMMNWMQRYAVVGGELGRPVLVANLLFATAAFFPSIRIWRQIGGALPLGAAIVCGALAVAFGSRLVRPAGGQRE